MFRKICAFLVFAMVGGFAYGDDTALQSVTSEVFYDTHEETEVIEEPEYEDVIIEPEPEPQPLFDENAVWPAAGSDADVEITCASGNCGGRDSAKIVTRVGPGLQIENNINTKGTGWSGGPNIVNVAPIPAGFDYDCANNAEMPLIHREMMEDDGSTVLSVSRSSRKTCNRQRGDSYDQFAQRAGFAPTTSCNQATATTTTQANGRTEININVNEYVDAEPATKAHDQVRSWVVVNGQTLRQVLQEWCDKEGWDLVWTSSREYPIEASAVFKGRFVDVASALIRNFERATPIPYGKFYKGNRVLVVSTNEE